MRDLYYQVETERMKLTEELKKERAKNEKLNNTYNEQSHKLTLLTMEYDVLRDQLTTLFSVAKKIGETKLEQDKHEYLVRILSEDKQSIAFEKDFAQKELSGIVVERDQLRSDLQEMSKARTKTMEEKEIALGAFKEKLANTERELQNTK